MRALVWFGADDHGWAPKVPLFGGSTLVDRSYDDGTCNARLACRQELGLPGSMTQFSWESAFWVNSAVAKMVYDNTDRVAPVVAKARQDFEDWLAPRVQDTVGLALKQFAANNHTGGIATLNQLSVGSTAEANARWTRLWQHLMVSFMDGTHTSGTKLLALLYYFTLLGMTTTVDNTDLLCGR
jgi:hypothetical protein